MAKEKETEAEQEGGKGGMKKIILIAVGALVLIGLSVGLTVMLVGGKDQPATPELPPAPVKGDPQFTDLKPFTVNLGPEDPVGFLQIQVQILTFFDEVAEDLEKNKPLIRNNLSLILGKQQSNHLRDKEGKEALRQEILKMVQDVVNQYGRGGEVDSVYFTNFVMQ